jgi:hypothetical protein
MKKEIEQEIAEQLGLNPDEAAQVGKAGRARRRLVDDEEAARVKGEKRSGPRNPFDSAHGRAVGPAMPMLIDRAIQRRLGPLSERMEAERQDIRRGRLSDVERAVCAQLSTDENTYLEQRYRGRLALTATGAAGK